MATAAEDNSSSAVPFLETLSRTERYRKFLKEGVLADVTFLVGKDKVPVRANKTILRFGSSVFFNMFDDESTSLFDRGANVYEVPDLEPAEFRQFLEYLYTGEIETEFKDAGLILKGAIRYGALDVVQRCIQQLTKELSYKTCASTLSLAIELKIKELEVAAIRFVCHPENAPKLFNPVAHNKYYFGFTEEALRKLLSRDELYVDELQLFKTIVEWGKREVGKTCESQTSNPKYLRSTLEKILPLIRFPLMKSSDFSTKVDPTELLTIEEVMAVVLCFNVDPADRASYKARIFNSKPRVQMQRKLQCNCLPDPVGAELKKDGRYFCPACGFDTPLNKE